MTTNPAAVPPPDGQELRAAVAPAPAAPVHSPQFCARRGSQWLTQDDLHAHLAALLRVENVGLLLGAGASLGALGGQTMVQVWQGFQGKFAKSYDWLLAQGFVQTDEVVNVEDLSDRLEIAAMEWDRVSDARAADLMAARANLARAVIQAAILNDGWWKSPENVGFDVPALLSHRLVLKKLTAARQPGQPAP